MEKYQEYYNDFIDKYNKTETTPSEAGEVLVRIAAHFPNYNISMIRAERAFALVSKDEVLKIDDNGKSISSAKADTISEASEEAFAYKLARGHVANIELLIGALKFLQKSLEVEYANSGLG